MSKLVYGKNGQVRFKNELEKQQAFDYLLNSNNVDIFVHEDNQDQGAWGSEERIHFLASRQILCKSKILTSENIS